MNRTADQNFKAKEVFAVYTGGGIWLFYGTTESGEHFLTDDYGFTLILNESAADFDESLYEDWQQAHLVAELTGKSRTCFCESIIKSLLPADAKHRGGITDEELEFYRNYFKLEY